MSTRNLISEMYTINIFGFDIKARYIKGAHFIYVFMAYIGTHLHTTQVYEFLILYSEFKIIQRASLTIIFRLGA